ncbi:von Willebrand factor A domain-containing protein 5A [Cyphellophora attinorum]|uniref:von Willebrand factor A domain-containing protein 5A n=1 Tax=Cyphellophora attinorum TaxID=1664694 RepID=A0A0N1H8K0_9EURO|nr:von Willebrand factor A domain-containing protein 5A [Phialophora attinorum]KPI43377.1 von Willebrand factor A domain-containing protein 5A [Phialophora attinorum]
MVRTNEPARGGYYHRLPHCGCWTPIRRHDGVAQKQYLPLTDLRSHTTILASSTRTTLNQTFTNSKQEKLEEVRYTFPLFDGVSIVDFKCVLDNKTLVGVVKEKLQARTDYNKAVARGETAGLLEQLPDASDVFTTKIGNVPPQASVRVEITYLGELSHDAEFDATRFTIPTAIAPRYGSTTFDSAQTLAGSQTPTKGSITISVDVLLDESTAVREIRSPSHNLAVTLGRTSTMDEKVFQNNCASASLALDSAELGKDFIFVLSSQEQGIPRAMFATHPTLPGRTAIMATLVPKFNVPNIVPEIVFVVDRSGSMQGKIKTLVSAMKIFLKSLPVNGIKFNICSFGSNFDFLFPRSQTYDQVSLEQALACLDVFDASYGGTEMLAPIKATCERRYTDLPLEVMLLTDGQIWNQQELFDYIGSQRNTRFFSLGIGAGASSALVEGIARSGGGFAQFVTDQEKMDKKIVRMLKGALTPHVDDYKIDIVYEDDTKEDEEFEVVNKSTSSEANTLVTNFQKLHTAKISLFDEKAKEEPTNPAAGRFDALPTISIPAVIQTPYKLPALYPFNRTTVYILTNNDTSKKPASLKLSGTCDAGPLELSIPVQDIGDSLTVHQLAAKKASQELEQGRGWLTSTKDAAGNSLKSSHEGQWDLIVERECVRIGTEYGIAGNFTSFVAVEKRDAGNGLSEGDIVQGLATTDNSEEPASKPAPGGLFAGAAFGASSGSLFGARSSTPFSAPAPCQTRLFSAGSGSLFGAPAASSFAAPAPSQPQLFGRAAGPTTGGSLFGSSQPSSPFSVNSKSAGLFGSTGVVPQTASVDMISNPNDDVSTKTGKRKARAGHNSSRGLVASASNQDDRVVELARSSVPTSSRDRDSPIRKQLASQPSTKPTSLNDEQKLEQVILLQKFDGSWSADDEHLWKLLGVERATVAETAFNSFDQVDPHSVATIAALAWFQAKMLREKEVWEMVFDKGKAWLESHQLFLEGSAGDMTDLVKALFE